MTIEQLWHNQKTEAHKQRAWGKKGMAVSAASEVSQIGADIMSMGGNAVDATVAMQFALAVAEPFNTGIAASGFMMIYDAAEQKTFVVSGHSVAPRHAHRNIFLDEHQNVLPFLQRSTPGTAVAVPGILKALETALSRFGSMSWHDVIAPAIALSEKGFRVNEMWHMGFYRFSDRIGEEARKFFYPGGVPLTEGEVVVNKELTNTLKILQTQGADAFYQGEIADAIIKEAQKYNGFIVKEDLLDYRSTVSEALTGTYRDYTIAVPSPPNAGGFALLYILKLLEKANIGQYPVHSWEKYYIIAEILRLTTADKLAFMGDPAFYSIPIDGLLSESYLEERLRFLNFQFRNNRIAAGNPWLHDRKQPHHQKAGTKEPGPSTSHFSAVDKFGNAAACTSSLEHFFGSGIMVPGYGFFLNNDMTDFDPDPAGLNAVEPGKYPVSMKTPAIIFQNDMPVMTIGSPGGSTIPASIAQTIMHLAEYKMDLKDAIEEPRIYNGTGPLICFEKGLPEGARQSLEEKNYQFDSIALPLGNIQAILRHPATGDLYGVSDSSRPGTPAASN